ncbi:MAG: GntR family transcriptional regulator [Puniceicoccaceae bacterium]
MIPFPIRIEPGEPVYEQVGKAVRRAMAAELLAPGDPFPSVRAISRELRINPNTTHKVIARLIDDGLLEVVPGRGTFVSRSLPGPEALRETLLEPSARKLAAEARRLGMGREDFIRYCDKIWKDTP